MDKGGKRPARVVLRVGGGSRHQLNVSECSDSAASCSETEVLDLDSKATTHYDHSSWANPVIGSHNEELERMNRTRNELKKEIFGRTFDNEEPRYSSTPLHLQLVAKHHKSPTRRSRLSQGSHGSQVYPEGMSQLRACLPGAVSASSSDCDEPDCYQVVDIHNDIVFPDRPNTVPHVGIEESLHKGQTLEDHSVRSKTRRGVQRNGHSPQYNSTSDSHRSPLHTIRSKSADVNSKSRRRATRLPPIPKRVNQIHPGNIDMLDSQSTPSPLLDTVLGEKKGFGVESTTLDRRLFSTTDSILSAAITPLLTSSLRKGGRKPSMDTCFDFDAEGQLESCFPDRHLRVFIVTWNMQEQKLLPDSLDDLLLPLSQEVAADMFVIGTQESTSSRREWEVLLQQTLGPSYVLVQSISLGIIYLTLYLRRDLIWFCSAVCSSSYATRPGTLIKTKGGVGLSFTLFGTSFLFITSHFTAHDQKVQERNSDMQRIASNLTLDGDPGDKGSVLGTYDHVFWFGDLNYRVEIEKEQADQCVATSDWKSLLLRDQLTREMLQGNVFPGFSEQPIAFPPSYKFDPDSDRYDTSEKKRVPSWTDRILFKSLKGSGVTGCDYNICRALRISDHRPVYAVFRVQLEPSRHIEGIPEMIVTFDRETYIKAQKRRRQLAEELAVQRTATDEPDGPGPPAPSSRLVTSSVCTIL